MLIRWPGAGPRAIQANHSREMIRTTFGRFGRQCWHRKRSYVKPLGSTLRGSPALESVMFETGQSPVWHQSMRDDTRKPPTWKAVERAA
jgi:hypothetical protein